MKVFLEIFKDTLFTEHIWTTASLERDSSIGISLTILRNFQESVFVEYLLATILTMFFIFFFADQRGLQPKINLFGGAMVN